MTKKMLLTTSPADETNLPQYPITPDPTADPLPTTVPYAMPAVRPYNVPTPTTTPTYDGTGHGFHPSVWDAGVGKNWNGHRYWMGMTPFHGGNEDLENPCILASDDGFTWAPPSGLVNPLVGRAGVSGWDYNSDTELAFIAEEGGSGTLYCFFRPCVGLSGLIDEAWYFCKSANGSAWTQPTQAGAWFDNEAAYASPAIVQLAPGDWRAFTNKGMLRAAHPAGPWSTLVAYQHQALFGRTWWHHDVEWVRGRFWAIVSDGGASLWGAVSRDGIHWQHGPDLMSKPSTNAWEAGGYYRPTFLQHPNQTKMRVWYSGYNLSDPRLDRRIGYTYIPNAEWVNLGG